MKSVSSIFNFLYNEIFKKTLNIICNDINTVKCTTIKYKLRIFRNRACQPASRSMNHESLAPKNFPQTLTSYQPFRKQSYHSPHLEQHP